MSILGRERRTGQTAAGLILAFLVLFRFAACRAGQDPTVAGMNAYLDAARDAWNFQGAVLVADRGRILLSRGVGQADLEAGVSNTPSTKFLIGSVTKTFTAAAVMKLVEEGKIRLDEPAGGYFPRFLEELLSGVTIHHLLSHTSGLPEIGSDPALSGNMSLRKSPRELLEFLRGRSRLFPPGSRAAYSNSGYLLLGLIIEKITGRPYMDYLTEHVLSPLGMTHTGYTAEYHRLPGFARGYREGPGGTLAPAPYIHPSLGYAAGGLYSTVEDMLLWHKGLERPDFLGRNTVERMFTPGKGGFGYGWMIMEAFGRRSAGHGGGAPGFNAWIERWVDDGAFVAVFANVSGAPVAEIGRGLAAILFGKDIQMPEARKLVPLDPASLEAYTGAYRTPEGSTRYILREGNTLFVRRDQGPRYPILPCGEDRFFFAHDKGSTLRFLRNDQGRVAGHVLHRMGVDEYAARIEE